MASPGSHTMEDIASHYADKIVQDDDHYRKLKKAMQRMRDTPLSVGTACSGTDGIIKWLEKFNDAMRSLGFLPMVACFFYFAFACESDSETLKFHTDQFGTFQPLFTDICQLGNESGAWEHHSAAAMLVPWVALLITGFSCKDVSQQSNYKRGRSDVIRTGKHSTGATWHGVLRYLANHRPWVCLAENVAGLWSQVDVMREQVEALGYQLYTIRLNAEEFCLPQRRVRIYFVIVHSAYVDFPWNSFLHVVEFLKTPALDIYTILASTSASSGMQGAAPSHLGELGSFDAEKFRSSGARQRQHACRKIGEKWFDQHRALFQQAGLPFVVPTDSELRGCARDGFLALSLRERSVVEYWTLQGCTQGFLDVSDSLERFQQVCRDGISCITTSAVYYNFSSEEKLDLPALWNLQGLDWNSWDNLNQYSNKLLKNLVGNSFSIPNMAAVVLAALLSLQWPCSEQEACQWMTRGIPRGLSATLNAEESGSPHEGPEVEDDANIVEFRCSGVAGFEDLADMANLC